MAQKRAELDQATFFCCICLRLLKDPVTIPCGHNYCFKCIKSHWDEEDERKVYSCPECEETEVPRPDLLRNEALADEMELLKKMLADASLDADGAWFYARPEDVACDDCTGKKLRAVKSCLTCLASYCDDHLELHYKFPDLRKHKLVRPSKKRVFFPELKVSKQSIQQRLQTREKDVKLLQQEVEAINRSADKAVEESEKILNEIIHLTQKQISDVKQQVRSQQETEERRVRELQEKLQQEIRELKRKDAEMERILLIKDQKKFRKGYSRLSPPCEPTDSSSIITPHPRFFEDVTAAVSAVKEEQQDVLRQTWTNIAQTVTEVDVLLSASDAEPKTRAGFLRYARDVTLDPNTAHAELLLSEGNRKATAVKPQRYPESPDRFDVWAQVLSTGCLTGRCYLEVEWRGEVDLALAYEDNKRKGYASSVGFGYNDKSWLFGRGEESYCFSHNGVRTHVDTPPPSSRLGVYLDHGAGVLSFYSVSDTMKLLHRHKAVFTQPLYAGLHFNDNIGDTAEFCKISNNGQSAATSRLLH